MDHSQSASARRFCMARISVWCVICTLGIPAWIQAQAPVPPVARELSNAFSSVSQQALPAVVAITVERTC